MLHQAESHLRQKRSDHMAWQLFSQRDICEAEDGAIRAGCQNLSAIEDGCAKILMLRAGLFLRPRTISHPIGVLVIRKGSAVGVHCALGSAIMEKGPRVAPSALWISGCRRRSAGGLRARCRFFGRFHRFGAAAGAPCPRQGDLHLVRGGDDRLHPAAVFFHNDAPTANLSGLGPTLGSVSPQFAAGIWPCLARLRFFVP